MRILLTNNHLNTFGGSETFVLTMYNTLRRMKHDVDVFTFHPFLRNESSGGVMQLIDDLKWVGAKGYENPPTGRYDLVLCNHNSCFKYVMNTVLFDKIYFFSHGTVPALEQPLPGANQYFSMSEEIQQNLTSKGFDSCVLRNPIDLECYQPYRKRRVPPKVLFCLSQGVSARDKIAQLGIPMKAAETNRYKRRVVENSDFNCSDLVFSLGRGVYESLACDRPPIIFDERGYNGEKYDGLVTQDNFLNLATFNCSGRFSKEKWNLEKVQEDISNISEEPGYYRAIAEQYLDSVKICKTILG